jgi:hypothetical protein
VPPALGAKARLPPLGGAWAKTSGAKAVAAGARAAAAVSLGEKAPPPTASVGGVAVVADRLI